MSPSTANAPKKKDSCPQINSLLVWLVADGWC
jgi:hypothetical protein